MVFWDHLGLSMVLFVVSILQMGLSLDLQGSAVTTTQSSVHDADPLDAELAVDQNLDTFSHTGFDNDQEKTNPWWKVDLGGVYCLRKITLVNSMDHADRLKTGFVRAGLNSNHLLNPVIGQVTEDQAIDRAVVDFTPEPYITAQYVSVNIVRRGNQAIVQLTEVMVEEATTNQLKDTMPSALTLIGLPSSQISSFSDQNGTWDADRAVDGALQYVSPYCSRTETTRNPWWKMDLKALHCISKIAIRNIDDLRHTTRLDLRSAVARAGLGTTPTNNPTCGSPVTQYQALINDWIEFTCDPLRVARYISIDIPRQTALVLCEVMVWQCDLQPAALTLVDESSNQSSTVANSFAGRALDGLTTDGHTYCSLTTSEMNPWWKVDLGRSYCVGKIRVWPFSQGSNFQQAFVRAGLSYNHTSNAVCGKSPAPSNLHVDFTCDPPVFARYVSVDIPLMASLGLCEVSVAACDFQHPVQSLNLALVINPALLGPTGDNDSVIAVYREPDDIASKVSFGRQVTTGGVSGLPSGSGEIVDPSLGCTVRLLQLPEEGGLDRTGVFYTEATKDDMKTRIQSIILQNDESNVHIRPAQRTLTASTGDSVMLQMHNVSSPNNHYRWRHNGGDVMESWNDRLNLSLSNVTKSDEGIYSSFVEDHEAMLLHGNMRLIVRACPFRLWDPPSCLKTCRRCYNGGVCDDKSGTCVCAPGFSGDSCEQVHGRHVFGTAANRRCSNSNDPHNDACRGRLFCLPDPYGCSCAAGYQRLDCMQGTDPGNILYNTLQFRVTN
ncbi:uncharacterized protein LOC110990560 [Acanthaster planci]|uniref:Uncharacterized protein LOC110990560 n=1 Tax=Acanthaster planci TaxID=133434 RepID=A0A8B8A1R7_ACAPL|nr:uncharacterized protein LOC110990560 [Acanthaster planci]